MKGPVAVEYALRIDRCPKCQNRGYIVRKCRRIGGRQYGPYIVVQHYASKSQRGTTRVKQCFISMKKLDMNEKTRIRRLLRLERELRQKSL